MLVSHVCYLVENRLCLQHEHKELWTGQEGERFSSLGKEILVRQAADGVDHCVEHCKRSPWSSSPLRKVKRSRRKGYGLWNSFPLTKEAERTEHYQDKSCSVMFVRRPVRCVFNVTVCSCSDVPVFPTVRQETVRSMLKTTLIHLCNCKTCVLLWFLKCQSWHPIVTSPKRGLYFTPCGWRGFGASGSFSCQHVRF